MATSSQPFSRLSGAISDYFLIETRMANTRAVQVFKALDKFRKQSVGLVLTRQSILPEDLDSFAPLVAQLGKVSEIRSFGVDANGNGFLVLPALDGYRIWEAYPDSVELERRYLSAVRLVGKLHQAGVVCGDLCLDSFLFSRSGMAQVLGGLGSLSFSAPQPLEPGEGWSSCVAPEQFDGEKVSCATDVFALGAVAHRLFTGSYPEFNSEGSLVSRVKGVSSPLPDWLEGFLVKTLLPSPGDRPQEALHLLRLISEVRESVASREFLPRTASLTQDGSVPALTMARAIAGEAEDSADSGSKQGESSPPFRAKYLKFIQVFVLAALLVTGIGIGLMGGAKSPKHVSSVDGSTESLNGLPTFQPGGNLTNYLSQIEASDDPLAHDLLVRALKDSATPGAAKQVWDSLIARMRRDGLARTADVLLSWEKSHPLSAKEVGFIEPFLRLADPALPTPVRLERLETTRSIDRSLRDALAVSIGLDLKDLKQFNHIFVQAAAEALQVDEGALHDRAPGSLVLVSPEVAMLFVDELISQPDLVSDQDLLWLLPETMKRESPTTKKISEQIVSRSLLTPVQRIFLTIFIKEPNVPPVVQESLVTCALGLCQEVDVRNFAAWYDTDSEVALWSLILSVQSGEARSMAFDSLATKPLLSAPIADTYEAVRAKLFDSRAACSIPLAALALESYITDGIFEDSLRGLDQIPNAPILIGILLSSASPRMVLQVVKAYGGLAESSDLIALLKYPDARVRAEAVTALSARNDEVLNTTLSESYKDETDVSVKTVYEEKVALIKESLGS